MTTRTKGAPARAAAPRARRFATRATGRTAQRGRRTIELLSAAAALLAGGAGWSRGFYSEMDGDGTIRRAPDAAIFAAAGKPPPVAEGREWDRAGADAALETLADAMSPGWWRAGGGSSARRTVVRFSSAQASYAPVGEAFAAAIAALEGSARTGDAAA